MKKIILAIDSFKGCLTSEETELAAAKGIRKVYPDCEIVQIPITDGGEGILNVLTTALKGEYITVTARNPLMESIEVQYGICRDGETALIEMAAISGLSLIAEAQRNPMNTTTYGMGELIGDALDRGCRKFIIGIGGSATNDAGLGMLQALGFRFLNKNKQVLGVGGKMMAEVADIDTSQVHPALKEAKFTVACDVNNPFYGENGAAFVFAGQKGADGEMIKALDNGMQSLAEVIYRTTGKDVSMYPGAGAAGGMGGGMLAFLNAELKSGISLVLEAVQFDEKIRNADLIITGEGKADRQTTMGKVPLGVLKAAKEQNIPVVIIAGSVEDYELINNAGFRAVFPIIPYPVGLEKAMESDFAKGNIERTVMQICNVIQPLQ